MRSRRLRLEPFIVNALKGDINDVLNLIVFAKDKDYWIKESNSLEYLTEDYFHK